MGSNAEEFPRQDDEITVLVTGFGVRRPIQIAYSRGTLLAYVAQNAEPFRAQHPINPSWEIARSLPPFLPPAKADAVSALAVLPPVRILIYPEPIRVAYKTVRELVPDLWAGRKIDYMIHIGMASGRKYYSVERRGHRDGYTMRDVNDLLLGDQEQQDAGENWAWKGMPEELLSSLDIDDAWRRWRTALPSTDIRVSEDAGRYLCDFIYYSSLSHLWTKGEEKRVVFLHVPVEADERALTTGVEVTIELIRALVQSGRMKKLTAGP